MEYEPYRAGAAVRTYYWPHGLNFEVEPGKLVSKALRKLFGSLFAVGLKHKRLVFIELTALFFHIVAQHAQRLFKALYFVYVEYLALFIEVQYGFYTEQVAHYLRHARNPAASVQVG